VSVHISDPIGALLPGAQPAVQRVRVLRDRGPFRAGDVLTWQAWARAYVSADGQWVALCWLVSWGWGVFFGVDRQTKPAFEQQLALAVGA
jgi:hypothetical protein